MIVPVAEERHHPVSVSDAVDIERARRAALGVVVLGAPVDVVEGLRVVDRDLVVLRDRKVRGKGPGLPVVPALIDAAIAASKQVVRLMGIERESMVIGCLLYTSPSPRDQRGSRMPSSA